MQSAPELACPSCLGELHPLDVREPLPTALCRGCDQVYSARAGYLDFIPQTPPAVHGFGPWLMHTPALAQVYDRWWRPFFVTVAAGTRPSELHEATQIDVALAPATHGAVLDLSCGPGATGRRLAATGQFARVYGLDWSLAMLARAVSAADEPGGAKFWLVRGDVGRLPFRSGSLAGVHAGAALHVWPDPAVAIAEVARVLRPGGVFIASTFVFLPSGRRRRVAQGFQAISQARVFEIAELSGLCASYGLSRFQSTRRGALILFSATRT